MESEDGSDPVLTSFPVHSSTAEHVMMATYSLYKNPRNGDKVITAPMYEAAKQSDTILTQQGKLNQFKPL